MPSALKLGSDGRPAQFQVGDTTAQFGRSIFSHANSADRTYTLPDVSGTVALLGRAQTWSAGQTIQHDNGLTVLTTAGATVFTAGVLGVEVPLASGQTFSVNPTGAGAFTIQDTGEIVSSFGATFTGTVTATTLAGSLNATNLTGTIAAARMPALTGDVTTSAGAVATTIGANAVTSAKFRQGAALSVVGNGTNATANVTDLAAGTDNQVLRRSGTAVAFGAVNLASSDAVTGQLLPLNGGVPTGTEVCGPFLTVPAGWLLEDGSAVSRTTYAALFAVMTIATTGNRTSGSAVITSIPSTTGLEVGFYVEGTGITAGTKILTVDSSTQVTLNANAGSTGTGGSLRFSSEPLGDGSTTFNLPDPRGRVMGAAGSGSGLTARKLGETVGTETYTLSISEIPAHTHNISWAGSAGVAALVLTNGTTAAGTGAFAQSAGGGAAHPIMQPTKFRRWIIKY